MSWMFRFILEEATNRTGGAWLQVVQVFTFVALAS